MVRALMLSLVLSLSLGCESYERFRADGTTVFRGSVYGDGEASFVRRGFPAACVAEIVFDPAAAQRVTAGSITVTTPDDVRQHPEQATLYSPEQQRAALVFSRIKSAANARHGWRVPSPARRRKFRT